MKVIIRTALVLFFSLTLSASLQSAGKMRIAIIDFKAKGVSKSLANTTSELIRTEMINTGKYIVIERAQMGEILKEQGFQQAGCTDISCAVEVGKILSAKKILIGTVSKLGSLIIINGRIVDVEKGVAEFGQKQSAKSEDGLYKAVTLFAGNLTRRIKIDPGSVAAAEEEEEEVLEPIYVPEKRITAAGTYLMPRGKLGSDVADQGLGVSVSFLLRNFLLNDSLFMVNASYARLKGNNADWVEKVDYMSLSLYLGYPIQVIRRLSVTPCIGGGYIMFTSISDPYGYNSGGSYSYDATTRYFDPMVSARLELSMIFTSSLQLVLTPSYIFYFEKSGVQQMAAGDVGLRFSF